MLRRPDVHVHAMPLDTFIAKQAARRSPPARPASQVFINERELYTSLRKGPPRHRPFSLRFEGTSGANLLAASQLTGILAVQAHDTAA